MIRQYTTAPLVHTPPDERRIFLTFDDGPDPHWTPVVLDLLAAHGVGATFFVIGRDAQAHGVLLRRIANAGHEIGNHTWSHRHPWTLPQHAARSEVREGAAAIADLVGRTPRYYRPPHGRLRRCMVEEAEDGGQRTVLWSASAVDWGPLGYADGIAARLARTGPGDIVLMHDGGRGINRPQELTRVLPAYLRSLSERKLTATALMD
jgi:peptidoglycan/xylan/chitin deacetylase (PgdA/CDA1 family)